MHRLTREEYNNTVRDLLGDQTRPAAGFSADGVVGVFADNGKDILAQVAVDEYQRAAVKLAAAAKADLSRLVPCTTQDAECATAFVTNFGRKAFRRRLAPEETSRYVAAYHAGAVNSEFESGIELVMTSMLQSPYFLYRVEVGDPVADVPGLFKLTPYEVASRLSYFLWKSMPDDELLLAAESGALSTVAGIDAQARRMIEHPSGKTKAVSGAAAFLTSFMQLGSLASINKGAEIFDDVLKASMLKESSLFAADVIVNGDATLSSLMTAPYTIGDERIAQLYGVPHPGPPGEFVRLELDPTKRSGFMTHPSLLSMNSHEDHTSPVKAGYWVSDNLLCFTPPAAPPDVQAEVANALNNVDPTLPTREQLAAHNAAGSTCASCHQLFDPLGMAFDHYDEIGRYREMVGGKPADSVGVIPGTVSGGEFDGAVQLSQKLATSPQVAQCFTRHWFRFAIAREPSKEDTCVLEKHVLPAFQASGGNLRELMLTLTTTNAFRYRRPPAQ
jgi:bacterioferritin-associated ferredoxin